MLKLLKFTTDNDGSQVRKKIDFKFVQESIDEK